ncbi:hypothetical protein J4440_02560 [Candidatus Woesearchaeota archaeon]|nr:hypothetical protein [Candidatus Woesearchaeota archaeon]
MIRGITNKNILDNFCEEFCKIIEKHCKYIIVSGFLAISTGRVRATEDIDMIMEKLDKNKFIKLHEELIDNNFVCVQSDNFVEIYEYLISDLSVRYTFKNKPLPEMEIKFAKDELDEYQLKTRIKLEKTGLDVWFGSIEMNIAFKEEYLKSNKDLEDARHLREIFKENINEDEIIKIKGFIRRIKLGEK